MNDSRNILLIPMDELSLKELFLIYLIFPIMMWIAIFRSLFND